MQIFNLLKEDHSEVKELLEKIQETGGMKTRQRLFDKAKKALMAHSHAEQQVFYSALEEHDESADLAMEAEVEHQVVERLLQDISDSGTEDSERWSAKCKVLKELVEHHIKEEESEIFKTARKLFGKSQLEEMGERFATAKEEQMQQA